MVLKILGSIFKKDESGGMAISFGVVSTVLLLGAGIAIDFAGLASKRQNLQNYADAAVLAAAVSGETTQAKLLSVAEASVFENDMTVENIELALTEAVQTTIQVKLEKNYDPLLLRILVMKTLR
jgi:Flp pilus assembly protein TadG